jgi:hypothetical protein
MTVTNAVETAMSWGTVSSASMVGMVISLLLSVGLPIFLGIFIYKKTKAWVPAAVITVRVFLKCCQCFFSVDLHCSLPHIFYIIFYDS